MLSSLPPTLSLMLISTPSANDVKRTPVCVSVHQSRPPSSVLQQNRTCFECFPFQLIQIPKAVRHLEYRNRIPLSRSVGTRSVPSAMHSLSLGPPSRPLFEFGIV
ncbi:hypothetical protein CEXT_551951 [Caerostris extrusa]|uniref:Secreted protein n=1 Tax=Caerostris extrusa TaxID=172846 RepID=A0AAV4U0Y5_CAEEX|nr:hypothetical protein CEXT_551951 [Caerostris extrusa]